MSEPGQRLAHPESIVLSPKNIDGLSGGRAREPSAAPQGSRVCDCLAIHCGGTAAWTQPWMTWRCEPPYPCPRWSQIDCRHSSADRTELAQVRYRW